MSTTVNGEQIRFGEGSSGAAARSAFRRLRLPAGATCACGETDPVVLDMDHTANFANDPTLGVPMCANCHRRATERKRRAGVPDDHLTVPTPLDRLAAILDGIAVALTHFGERLADWAAYLRQVTTALVAAGFDPATVLPPFDASLFRVLS